MRNRVFHPDAKESITALTILDEVSKGVRANEIAAISVTVVYVDGASNGWTTCFDPWAEALQHQLIIKHWIEVVLKTAGTTTLTPPKPRLA